MAESPDSRSLVSASSQLNLMEIEAIDDKEFDIPQVDTPPTLESILNEDKVDAGLPTAITVSNVIAVGTSHGLALVFDQNQALRLCLGTTATGAEYGAVSALSINHDCTRLLCGFAKGQITMWDLANGKLLRTMTDTHPPGTAILHVKTDPASVPLLAWQFVAAQKTINPILAFCRGNTIHFLLVKKDESGTIHVIKQRQLQLNCDFISLSWINPRTLVLMVSTEKLRVVDRPSQEELETVDMAELQLVYNSSHFKSLATG
ncbi:hypothetical protein cypCar_00041041 [Cyprinus carpio]|nr:hypothetical protein cypCar_00041041 [Cyprinus carpio]